MMFRKSDLSVNGKNYNMNEIASFSDFIFDI